MGRYLEASLGKAAGGRERDMGRRAAARCLSRITKFQPVLAMAFVASELDIPEAVRGVTDVLGDCPVIGSSTAGEIANGAISHSVVVSVVASPHLKVRVGCGSGVTNDHYGAIRTALTQAQAIDYFSAGHPLHQTLYMSGAKNPGVSPVLAMTITPGATRSNVSLGHEIHTALRTASANRIPIFGGTSGDYFHFEKNYQVFNGTVVEDSLVLAFIEAEILFGIGVAHGFSPTTRRALVTRASGHIVYELDGQPAAKVCARLLGMPPEQLGNGAVWFSQFPFGGIDAYGNSLLYVPEHVLPDGSIQFGPIMRNDQVITLMRAREEDIVQAGKGAYEKALYQGGLKKPSFAVMYSCALRKRLMGERQAEEVALVRRKAKIPVCGFYTFGEQGLTDDGLPVFANQSVSTLIFSDELNPVTAFLQKGKRIYHEYQSRVDRQVLQMKVMSRASRIVQETESAHELLQSLADELALLVPGASIAFYLSQGRSLRCSLTAATGSGVFNKKLREGEGHGDDMVFALISHRRLFGLLVLRPGNKQSPADQESLVMFRGVARLAARGLQRIDTERELRIKLLQLELLNSFGQVLGKAADSTSQVNDMVRVIKRVMKFSCVILWILDPAKGVLVREAASSGRRGDNAVVDAQDDEKIARWQGHNRRTFFSHGRVPALPGTEQPPKAPFRFASVPVFYRGHFRAALNLYWTQREGVLPKDRDFVYRNPDLLESISSQLGVVIENRFLEKHSILNKEIHHRVKNNLQNVASILRLQISRLNRISPEEALADSVSRIISIAAVHDTLCQGEIGMVDVHRLVERIADLSLSGQNDIPFTLDAAGALSLMPSKEATSLALVVNELVQNAIKHKSRGNGFHDITINIGEEGGRMSLVVSNPGALPPGFNASCDGNLGLMIVRMLTKDELRGRFLLDSLNGVVTSRLDFPVLWNHNEAIL